MSYDLKTYDDCVNRRNLFLVHIGHSWVVLRATGKDSVQGGAVPLFILNKIFPESAMIEKIEKITNPKKLYKYAKACGVDQLEVIEWLNKPLCKSGYEIVLGASNIGLPFEIKPD